MQKVIPGMGMPMENLVRFLSYLIIHGIMIAFTMRGMQEVNGVPQPLTSIKMDNGASA